MSSADTMGTMSNVVEFPAVDTFAAHVAANIRAEAARRGVTQVQIAQHLGVNQSVVSHRYRGHREWSLSEIEAVARLLRTTTSELVRHQGLEPRTRWFGAWHRLTRHDVAVVGVVDLAARRAQRAAECAA